MTKKEFSKDIPSLLSYCKLQTITIFSLPCNDFKLSYEYTQMPDTKKACLKKTGFTTNYCNISKFYAFDKA